MLGIIHNCLIYFYKRYENYSKQLSKNYQKIDELFLKGSGQMWLNWFIQIYCQIEKAFQF